MMAGNWCSWPFALSLVPLLCGLPPLRHLRHSGRALRCLRHRVVNDLFELFEIRNESLAAVGAQPAECLRPPVFKSFPHVDEASLAQHVEMTTQITVRQRAQTFQFSEAQPCGAGDERRHEAEPRLLMEHALQPFIRKPTAFFVVRLLLPSHHSP